MTYKRVVVDGDDLLIEGFSADETQGIIAQINRNDDLASQNAKLEGALARIERKIDEILLYLDSDTPATTAAVGTSAGEFSLPLKYHCGEECCQHCCGCEREDASTFTHLHDECWCDLANAFLPNASMVDEATSLIDEDGFWLEDRV